MTPDRPRSPLDEPPFCNEYDELLHYTSIPALHGILKSNTIWATHTAHLNDTSEMRQIVPSFLKACIDRVQALASARGGSASRNLRFVTDFGSAAGRAATDALTGTGPGSARVFVASFAVHTTRYARENGMLSQWRGYCGPDGVAIVFDARRLEKLLQQEAKRFLYLWCGIADVVYDLGDFDLADRFPTLVNELQDFLCNLVDDAESDSDQVRNNRLVEHLLPAMARVKHRAFVEEGECRILAAIPSPATAERLRTDAQATKQDKRIHHRTSQQGSVPYIRLFDGFNGAPSRDDLLPITEVLIGPSRNQDAHHEAVLQLVAQHRRTRQIDVRKSEIPFVSTS